jgi:hypothetical protein
MFAIVIIASAARTPVEMGLRRPGSRREQRWMRASDQLPDCNGEDE